MHATCLTAMLQHVVSEGDEEASEEVTREMKRGTFLSDIYSRRSSQRIVWIFAFSLQETSLPHQKLLEPRKG
jgi:hypothetical protein